MAPCASFPSSFPPLFRPCYCGSCFLAGGSISHRWPRAQEFVCLGPTKELIYLDSRFCVVCLLAYSFVFLVWGWYVYCSRLPSLSERSKRGFETLKGELINLAKEAGWVTCLHTIAFEVTCQIDTHGSLLHIGACKHILRFRRGQGLDCSYI